MENSLMTIIGIFLVAVLMFVVPLMIISERNDDISQSVIQTAVSNFVDTVSNTGAIKPDDYEDFNSKLGTTGNTFEITIEVQHLDENPGKKATSTVGENLRYSTYTTEILDYMYPSGGEPKSYPLKKGDNIIVTVRNTNETIAQQLRKFAFKITGKGNYELYASGSSMIINSESVISYVEIEDSVQIPQKPVNPSVPVVPEIPETPEIPEEEPVIASWEQSGKEIYGKDNSGNVLVTLKIGDFVNYNHKNGNTYTSPASGNGVMDQTFTTDKNLSWMVIGVDESGDLLLLCYSIAGSLKVIAPTKNNLENICIEIENISSIFKNTYANNARSINSNDIIRLCDIYGVDVREYGKGCEAFYSFSTTGVAADIWGGGYAGYSKGEFTNCNQELVDILFGNGQYCFLPDKVIHNNDVYGLDAIQKPYLAYAWLFVNDIDWPGGRTSGVKPVIELGTGFKLKKISVWNGYAEWNIVE